MKPQRLSCRRGAPTLYCVPSGGKKRWEVRWHWGGKILRRKFTDKPAALSFAQERDVMMANGELWRAEISAENGWEWKQCAKLAAEFKLTPYDLCREAADLRRKQQGTPAAHQLHVDAILARFLAIKRGQGLSGYHLRDLEGRLSHFAKDFQLPLSQITSEELRAWLGALVVGPRTSNNYLAAIRALAKYAHQERLVPPTWDAMDSVEMQDVSEREPVIFSADQMRMLLEGANDRLQRCLALSAFAGLRSEEVSRMVWEDINWKAGLIFLRRSTVKGRAGKKKPRSVPLADNLREWLKPWQEATGKVSPYQDSKSLSGMKWKLAQRLGLKWERNALRKTWISCQVALSQNIGQVATLAGNSTGVIRDNYLNLVTPEQAEAWFALRPRNTSNGLLSLNFG